MISVPERVAERLEPSDDSSGPSLIDYSERRSLPISIPDYQSVENNGEKYVVRFVLSSIILIFMQTEHLTPSILYRYSPFLCGYYLFVFFWFYYSTSYHFCFGNVFLLNTFVSIQILPQIYFKLCLFFYSDMNKEKLNDLGINNYREDKLWFYIILL